MLRPPRITLWLLLAATATWAVAAVEDAETAPWLATPVTDGVAPEGPVEWDDAAETAKLAASDPEEIRFRNGLVLRPEPGLHPATPLAAGSVAVLQFSGPVRAEWLAALRARGIVIHEHVQSYAVLASLPEGGAARVAALLADGTLRGVLPYPAAAKIGRGQLAHRHGTGGRVHVHRDVWLPGGASLPDLVRRAVAPHRGGQRSRPPGLRRHRL